MSNTATIQRRRVAAKERLGLVTIHGEDWQIVDIGMRELTPRELARCQGFPDDYILTGTKTSQVARIGNSVCPHVVEALVRANVEVA
jgi:DNA (cytosine-5)-methyltransferase 1